jgi:hypothetical protein
MTHHVLSDLVCALVAGPVAAGEKVALEADDDYAPYTYVEKGQPKGICVEFLKKVAEKLAPAHESLIQGFDDARKIHARVGVNALTGALWVAVEDEGIRQTRVTGPRQ